MLGFDTLLSSDFSLLFVLNLDDFLSILLKLRLDKNIKQSCKGQGQGRSHYMKYFSSF